MTGLAMRPVPIARSTPPWPALVLALLLSFAALWAPAGAARAQAVAPGAASAATAQPATPATAPRPAQAAALEPRSDDSNAVRAKTQPGNNAPFWRGVRESGNTAGVTNLPGAEKGVLVQQFVQYPGSRFTTAGEAWREVRNRWLIPYGGALLVIVALAIALYHWRHGPMGGHEVATGRMIERFTPFERAAHWANAIAFVVLAVSGIVMAFGKFLLLPLIGLTLFGWLTYALKNLHNFAGPLFAVSLAVVFFTFLRSNWPTRDDWLWLKRGGGMFGGVEPPSRRFNGGEKIVFWAGVLGLGIVVVASGMVLDKLVPGLGETRAQMQIAHMVHAVGTVLMMAMFMGHIYLGTLGMKGAYSAMRTGYVDQAWAEEHHRLWAEDVKAGRIPAQRSVPLATAQPGLGSAAVQR